MTLERGLLRLRVATELLAQWRAMPNPDGVKRVHGVTILVHGLEHERPQICAMQTTLPSRKEVRRLLVHVLYKSLLADGATVDNIDELAARELAEFVENGPG